MINPTKPAVPKSNDAAVELGRSVKMTVPVLAPHWVPGKDPELRNRMREECYA